MDGKKDQVDSSSLDDYPSHVNTIWRLSYDRLSGPTAKLMSLCAHLHHAGITERIFKFAYYGLTSNVDVRTPRIPFMAEEPIALQVMESFGTGRQWNTDDFRRCIQEACSFSPLSYDGATRIYLIHPFVHDCLRSVAPHPSQATFLLSAAIIILEEGDQAPMPELLPHVQRVLSKWADWRTSSPPLHPKLATNMGRILFHCAKWYEAEPL